jgi:hypothetical protein
MAIRAHDGRQHILPLQDVAAFDIAGRLLDYGFTGEYYAVAARSTSVAIPYRWTFADGSGGSFDLKLRARQAVEAGW